MAEIFRYGSSVTFQSKYNRLGEKMRLVSTDLEANLVFKNIPRDKSNWGLLWVSRLLLEWMLEKTWGNLFWIAEVVEFLTKGIWRKGGEKKEKIEEMD